MSFRSTLDAGLAALTAPMESSAAVSALAMVGAAVAGLATVVSAAEQIAAMPVLHLPWSDLSLARDLARERSVLQGRLGCQNVVERLIDDPIDAPSARREALRKLIYEDNGPEIIADMLLERGDELGCAMAFEMGKVPYLNLATDNILSAPLNEELGGCTKDGPIWRETLCSIQQRMAAGGIPYITDDVAVAMLDRLGFDGKSIVDTYGSRGFKDFVVDVTNPSRPAEYEGFYRDHQCMFREGGRKADRELHICSLGPLPRR